MVQFHLPTATLSSRGNTILTTCLIIHLFYLSYVSCLLPDIHDIHPYFMINRFTHNDYAINPSSLNIFGESVINFIPFVFVDEIIQNSTYVCASFVLIITVDEI